MAKKAITVKKKKEASGVYDADSLRKLPYPDCVRKRIGMYLGGADENGAYRALKEIVDNSLDEAMAGHGKRINIIYSTSKNIITVIDQGRGLPMGKNKDGEFASEIALATLHGSGKFDNENYQGGVVGLNGVGAACTNAVSEYFVVWSKNSKKWTTQRFERGIKKHDPKPEDPKSKIALKNDKGTIIQFKLDKQIFGDVVVDPERIHREMNDLAILNPGVAFVVTIDDETTTYLSANGLIDMVVTKDVEKIIIGKPYQLQKKGVIDLVLCWVDDSETNTFSYVNSSFTSQEGTHVQGARAAILEALKAELSEKDKIDPKFFLKGMRLALNWRMENPIYYGQTKDRLTNSDVVTTVKKLVVPSIVEFLKKNKALVNTLIDRAKKFQKNEEKFNADNKAVKTIKLGDPNARGILPGKFQPAPGYKPDEKELILVEGDSCGGSASKSRMPWQEILPLRGKIPNPERTPFAKFIENAEVCNIFTAVGALPGDPYDSKKRRVGKVSFLPDADPDGKHIGSELIAFFVRYLPDWIKTGHVFFIDAPLFVGGHRGVKKYGNTRDEVLAQFPERDRKSVLLTRMKGWGECQSDDMHEIAMNPATRRVRQYQMNDGDEVIVNNVMGDEVEHRKVLLGIKGGSK